MSGWGRRWTHATKVALLTAVIGWIGTAPAAPNPGDWAFTHAAGSGIGMLGESLTIEGDQATLTVTHGEGGQEIGVFQTSVSATERERMERALPETFDPSVLDGAGPAPPHEPIIDGPRVVFRLQNGDRDTHLTLNPSDARRMPGYETLREVTRAIKSRARRSAVHSALVEVEVSARSHAGRPTPVRIRMVNAGSEDVCIRDPARALSAGWAVVTERTPGVTPLSPRWRWSHPDLEQSSMRIPAHGEASVDVLVSFDAAGPHWVKALVDTTDGRHSGDPAYLYGMTRSEGREVAVTDAKQRSAGSGRFKTRATVPGPDTLCAEQTCADLDGLQTFAARGALGVDGRQCLAARLDEELPQTTRVEISRLLIQDARSRDDETDWLRRVENHLEDIDSTDPVLCLAYAKRLWRSSVDRSSEVVTWAGAALENQARWSEQTRTRNVSDALKHRALASAKRWKSAQTRAAEARNETSMAEVARLRALAATHAQAWLTFAREHGEDTHLPGNLCISATGRRDACAE